MQGEQCNIINYLISNQQQNLSGLANDLQSDGIREDSDVIDHRLELSPPGSENRLEFKRINLARTIKLSRTSGAGRNPER